MCFSPYLGVYCSRKILCEVVLLKEIDGFFFDILTIHFTMIKYPM